MNQPVFSELEVGPAPDGEAADGFWMQRALDLAREAEAQGEVPIGAVLVDASGHVLGAAHNSPITLQDPTAHCEILALRQAARRVHNYRLPCTALYVTLEPCLMCAGALVHARIRRLVYGAQDPKGGAVESLYHVLDDPRLNHRVEVTGGVLAGQAAALLHNFFRARR